ncbi:MAG: hypothetical protein Q9M44_05660 [Ghiorsea sp.]|nr:hypothetical protein [Ghiorsea sp.]
MDDNGLFKGSGDGSRKRAVASMTALVMSKAALVKVVINGGEVEALVVGAGVRNSLLFVRICIKAPLFSLVSSSSPLVVEEWFSFDEYGFVGSEFWFEGFALARSDGLMLNSKSFNLLASYLGNLDSCLGKDNLCAFIEKLGDQIEKNMNEA